MLRALDDDGNNFLGRDLTPENRDQNLRCPGCEEKVLSVIPTQNIAKHFRHFRHSSDIRCTPHEPETPEHMNLKNWVEYFAERGGLRPVQEPRPPIYGHRPDLRLTVRHPAIPKLDSVYCVEIQCSTIPPADLRARNESYRRAGYKPVWIFGKEYIKRLSSTHYAGEPFTPMRPNYLPPAVQCLYGDPSSFPLFFAPGKLSNTDPFRIREPERARFPFLQLSWTETDEDCRGWGTLTPRSFTELLEAC